MKLALFCSRLTTWDRLKTLGLVVGLLSLTACQSVPSSAQAQNPASLPRTLTVSGKGKITFVATDEAIAQAQQQAIKQASEDARKQAGAALGALNLSQREVIGIQINGANPPQLQNYASPAALTPMPSDSAKTPVVAAQQKVEQTVTLQIRY